MKTLFLLISAALILSAALCAALVAFSDSSTSDLIRHRGFEDFAKGTPGNSGHNVYVSRKGRVEVINKWDLNADGYNDVLISNDHDVFEIVDAFIYWNSPNGFHSLVPDLWREIPFAQTAFDLMDHRARLTRLPAFGGGRSVIADLNKDGYPDIVFCNYIHNYPGLRNAYIYWGGPDGYSASNRTELPTNWAGGVAAADLNGDGYPELVFANHGTEAGLAGISADRGLDSYIYWGSASGYDASRRSLLKTHEAVDVAIADINHDGFPDVAFLNDAAGAKDIQVFWGSAKGYAADHTQTLPSPDPTTIRAADVNGDGFADLVVTTSARAQTIYLENSRKPAGDRAVRVFLGGADGLSAQRVILLPSYDARDTAIGDFNHDGFADIAVANFAGPSNAPAPSFVYWGSKEGFSSSRRTELPTLAANGVTAADLNGDGFLDLVFANSNDGDTHDVPSYI